MRCIRRANGYTTKYISEVDGVKLRINLGDLVTLLTTGRRERKEVIMRRYGFNNRDLSVITEALGRGDWRVVYAE